MNQTKIPRAAGIAAAVLAAALTAAPLTGAWAAFRAEAEQAIAAAKAANDRAAAAGVQASETAQMIKEAQTLLPTRQYTKAIELAEQAKKQDQYALSQAVAAKAPAAEAPKPAGGEPAKAPAAPQTATSAQVDEAIAAAEEARKKAGSVGGEWRDTEKMIKDAQGLAKSGELDAALKLANKARRQGELGYAQAHTEKGAGFPAYMIKKN